MSRSAVPSQGQVEKLVEYVEEKRWLATGHARTAHARDRTKTAWQDLANKLNSDGRGCIKTWQQWAKYWKDKKAAVKKKASQIRLGRQQTGGGVAENIYLSAIEERILAVMGGETFAVGDRIVEISTFDDPTMAMQTHSERIALDLLLESDSPSILQGQNVESMMVEAGTAADEPQSTFTITEPRPLRVVELSQEPQPGPSWRVDAPPHLSPPPAQPQEVTSEPLYHHPSQEENVTTMPTPRNNPSSVTSSPRRRRLTATRRRVLRRSPPSQRQSQMASLTERFIVIEERRAETNSSLARNQQSMIDIMRQVSQGFIAIEERRAETQRCMIDIMRQVSQGFLDLVTYIVNK